MTQAKRLSEERLAEIREDIEFGDHRKLVAELYGHIDAIEAAAAAREEQVRVLRGIVSQYRHPRDLMVRGCQCGWCQVDKALAALNPTGDSDGFSKALPTT